MGSWGVTMRQSDYGLDLLGTIVDTQLKAVNFLTFKVADALEVIKADTLQLKDYSKLDWEWSMFDPEAKKLRHETMFPQECAKAYDMGAALVMKGEA